MQIERVDIKKLNSPEWNPRKISDDEKKKLMNSLETFGYIDPIIVNRHNMNIVGGNQRYHAMLALGWDEVDVIFIDEPNLDKEKAMNIALNKISGDWDKEKLEVLLDEIDLSELDVELTGFDDVEILEMKLENDIVYASEDFSEHDLEDLYEEPEIEIRVCPHCGFEDQLVNFKIKGSE